MSRISLKKHFQKYKDKIIDNEFFIHVDDGVLSPTNSYFCYDEKDVVSTSRRGVEDGVAKTSCVLKKRTIDFFHPDKINVCGFWKKLHGFFPLAAVCQPPPQIIPKNSEEMNYLSLNSCHIPSGAINKLLQIAASMNYQSRILEIGPGYGNVLMILNHAAGKSYYNYYAIDVFPLFECKNLYKCDGKNIPDTIPPGMDVVYSVNVFQHLSGAQRSSYFRQIYLILKPGGKFLFSSFVQSEENKDNPNFWSYSDEGGKRYTQFFGQFTEVMIEEEFLSEVKDIGFGVETFFVHGNYKFYELTKNALD